jgi:hypothetical protein
MKSFMAAVLLTSLGSTAYAVSNGPLPHYMANYGCGPQEKIPEDCSSEDEVRDYCEGFKSLVSEVSNAGKHIPSEGYAVWCWTILEDWTQCRIPSPKLQTQCVSFVKGLASPTGKGSCKASGFEVARQMYQDDVKLKCPATE